MSRALFECRGGRVEIPERGQVLVDRLDGGNLIMTPPRRVWDRTELSSEELTFWSFLVAATARAMLEELPQLAGGCINYWDAGNWALNDQAEPKGPKRGPDHRSVHLHLLGRNREATDPSWRWGEAPRFPDYAERLPWTSRFNRLTSEESQRVVSSTSAFLKTKYGFADGDMSPWFECGTCRYPTPLSTSLCEECAPGD